MFYDSWAHAASLGLTVTYGPLSRQDHDAEYLHDDKLVILRRGLTTREERCTLAHEIVHAEREDTPMPYGPAHDKRERLVNRIAANRLICDVDLMAAVAASDDPGQWCLELFVTAEVLETYLTSNYQRASA
ncbi:ImmA/IrrE family metallo-endopeptidase [Lysinibacter cavernae]|uniref:Zn-dependent peptidase ImmA (M78 family) n=1 Tax=Lysinibacter cavernae TaxID=1640652 RepID=A0A7X5TS49_9MICO|nr:Zn-dependent peptidase ImmA (M78 family) [Lysinibacter cavernae]